MKDHNLVARLCSGEKVPEKEIITALREREAEIDILSNNLEAEELCRAEITDFVTEELEPQIAELQARIEELEEKCKTAHESQNNAWLRYEAQGEENKRLDAALAEIEQLPYRSDVIADIPLACEIARKARAGE